MSNNRCFNSVNQTITNASDLIHSKRQKTIYRDLSQNTTSALGPNPIKLNGRRYNSNFIVKGGGVGNNACLASTKNYELLLDLAKGKRFSNPVLDGNTATTDEHWVGNILHIDYTNNNINPLEDNEITYSLLCGESEYAIDPEQRMFYPDCNIPFIKSVGVIDFRNTNYYWKALNAQPLTGMRYPAPLRIGDQETDQTTAIFEIYGPTNLPNGQTVRQNWCIGKHAIK